MSHAKLTATSFVDGKFTIDDEPFPYEVRSIQYRLDGEGNSFPTLTIEVSFDQITIEHGSRPA